MAKHPDGEDVMKPGAVYLGHIPHGFYENEMRGYFSQFGKVTRLKLFRSKKTGRSRGYAFIEFECSEVAKVVAETMNNYLLFEKLLKCRYVDPTTLKPATFKQRLIRKRREKKPKTIAEVQKYVGNVLKREKSKRQKLKNLGIDYDFPGYSASLRAKGMLKKSKHTRFADSDDEVEEEEEEERLREETATVMDVQEEEEKEEMVVKKKRRHTEGLVGMKEKLTPKKKRRRHTEGLVGMKEKLTPKKKRRRSETMKTIS